MLEVQPHLDAIVRVVQELIAAIHIEPWDAGRLIIALPLNLVLKAIAMATGIPNCFNFILVIDFIARGYDRT